MPKSPDAFRTISEVADWLDKPAHVLRFWESKFTQVKPVKRAGGRRYYRPDDMLLLGGIKKLLHDDGMTIKGVQKVLREQGIKYVTGLSQPLDEISAGAAEGLAQDHEATDDYGGYAAFENAEEETEQATVIAFQRSRDPETMPDSAPPEARDREELTETAQSRSDPQDQQAPEPASDPRSPDPVRSDTAPGTVPEEAMADPTDAPDDSPGTGQAGDTPLAAASTEADPSEATTPAPADTGALPAFLRPAPEHDAGQPAQEPQADPEAATPAAAPRAPIVIDVPDTPPADQITAPPGLLSALLARRAPLPDARRQGLTAARDDLTRLRARMAQRLRD